MKFYSVCSISHCQVYVEVVDINDSAPRFPHHRVTLTLSEMAAVGSVFALPAASDADSLANGIMRYALQQADR